MVLALCVALAGASCAGDDGPAVTPTTVTPTTATASSVAPTTTTPTTAPTAPTTTVTTPAASDRFYVPDQPLPTTRPGALLRSESIDAGPGTRGWRILYVSQRATGEPVAVSGLVVVGDGAAPAGGRPVLSWAHGTTGLGDGCAVSRQFTDGRSAERLLAPLVVGAGYAFVATDYEGLGTPGEHPYVMGRAEGRNVLDVVRAAAALSGSGIEPSSKVLVWGHSQGGGAAAWAAELQPAYAPELALVGAAIGAPAAELRTLGEGLRTGRYSYFGLMTVAGIAAAYSDADPATVLTTKGSELLGTIRSQCTDDISRTLRGLTTDDLVRVDPTTVAPWSGHLDANTAGQVAPRAPLFVYHGSADDLIPPAISAALAAKYCARGATVQRKVFPGDHTSVIALASGDLLRWFADRVRGTPASTTC
jgi:pimeloyl-ACP methyl ester carboxylesterase